MIANPQDLSSNVQQSYENGGAAAITAILVALGAVLLILVVIFVYLNSRWCVEPALNYVCEDPFTDELEKVYTFNEISTRSDSEGDGRQKKYPLHINSTSVNHMPELHYGQPANIQTITKEKPSRNHKDLMSLAESIKVGRNSVSSSGSTTSADEESSLRYRDKVRITSHHITQLNQTLEEVSPSSLRDSPSEHCIVMFPQESLFDITDLQSTLDDSGSNIIGRSGLLEVAFAYDAPMRKMTIHILQARDIPAKERGGPIHTQVRAVLLPSKKQKYKSKIRHGDNPQFVDSFLLHKINPEDVNSMKVRFRLYSCERMKRERLLGECMVSFSKISLELEANMWLPLEPRTSAPIATDSSDILSLGRSDSTGSCHSILHGGVPELLLGLSYNGMTGRVFIEIIKGSHFRNAAITRAPDTYVKLMLMSSSGQEMARAKSSVRRGQPNPLFKETFVFQVALFQLQEVTLVVSVYDRKSLKKKHLLGWFSLGQNSTSQEELAHWNDMCAVKAEQIARWHTLICDN